MTTKKINQLKNNIKGVKNNTIHNICTSSNNQAKTTTYIDTKTNTIVTKRKLTQLELDQINNSKQRQFKYNTYLQELDKMHTKFQLEFDQKQKELLQAKKELQELANDGNIYMQSLLTEYYISDTIKQTEILYKLSKIIVKSTINTYFIHNCNDDIYILYKQSRLNFDKLKDKANQTIIPDLHQIAIQYILESMQENPLDYNKIIKNGFKGINNYLYSEKSIKLNANSISHIYINELQENGVYLVSLKDCLMGLFNENDQYNPDQSQRLNQRQKRQIKALQKAIKNDFTPIQKTYAKYIYKHNVSIRQMAKNLNRQVSTISESFKNMRIKANQYLDD